MKYPRDTRTRARADSCIRLAPCRDTRKSGGFRPVFTLTLRFLLFRAELFLSAAEIRRSEAKPEAACSRAIIDTARIFFARTAPPLFSRDFFTGVKRVKFSPSQTRTLLLVAANCVTKTLAKRYPAPVAPRRSRALIARNNTSHQQRT